MKKKLKLSKLLINMSVFIAILSSVMFLFLKSSLSDTNIEVEKLKRNIEVESNKIESLSMKVDELKSLANVENAIESEGLGYNSTNIKVLSKK